MYRNMEGIHKPVRYPNNIGPLELGVLPHLCHTP